MIENCLNCKHFNGEYCNIDEEKEVLKDYEREATWCTEWE